MKSKHVELIRVPHLVVDEAHGSPIVGHGLPIPDRDDCGHQASERVIYVQCHHARFCLATRPNTSYIVTQKLRSAQKYSVQIVKQHKSSNVAGSRKNRRKLRTS